MNDGFPQRVQAVRTHFGLTAAALSSQVGLKDRNTWHRYERGETRPNSDILTALYRMGIDIHWLLSGEGAMLRAPAPEPTAGPDDSAGGTYTQTDRLYEIAIKATLRWYETAGLALPPDGLAGVVSRAVRMLRARAGDKTDAEFADEVVAILDVARDMLTSTGWSPKAG